MGRVILFTGGCRSGKSRLAQKMAERLAESPRVYVATCPIIDEETRWRAESHRNDRAGRGWRTVEVVEDEEQSDLDVMIAGAGGEGGVVLVDCLSLWINNLMHAEDRRRSRRLSEEYVAKLCKEILRICSISTATVIFVTNEVGMGIVPADPATRFYRDLLGRCNQKIAAGADEVYFVVCGIPMTLKKINAAHSIRAHFKKEKPNP